MKAIRFILALYILFLAIYPCRDSETCVKEPRGGIALIAGAFHGHATDGQDLCTPFCVCVCCAHVQLNQVAIVISAHHIPDTHLATLYREKPVLTDDNSIWQPPRV